MINNNKSSIPYEIYNKSFSITAPKLSPDGKKIAFILKHGSGNTLSLLDIKTKIHKPLVWSVEIYPGFGGAYSWSPNSDFIVYRNRNGHLFKITISGKTRQLTHDDKIAQTPKLSPDGKLVLYVADSHHTSYLAYVGSDGRKWPQDTGVRMDFIQDPVWSPDGKSYACMGYNNPFMPWDKSSIYIGNIKGKVKSVHEGESAGNDYSVCQPLWSPRGNYLSFISDRNGYYNLWVMEKDKEEPYCLIDIDKDMVKPSWGSGNIDYVWSNDESFIIFNLIDNGKNDIYHYDMKTKEIKNITNYAGFYSFLNLYQNKIYCLYESSIKQAELLEIDKNDGSRKTLFSPSYIGMDSYAFSNPTHIEWTNNDSKIIYGLLYPAQNKKIDPAPLLVYVHGGPTDLIMDRWNIRIQYFASRGWNVLAVNYRGSGGYGRDYRQCLNGNWGIYDVEDCKSGVENLIKQGKASNDMVVILGGSAGGYTTLMSLSTYPDFYKAGVSLYGVTDLYELSLSTHRLEAYYNDRLIGDMFKEKDKYYNRSPLNIADRIKSPLFLLQGDRDRVVSKEQAEYLIDKLKDKEGFQYKFYEGEGHGFSKEKEADALHSILDFLNKYVIYR